MLRKAAHSIKTIYFTMFLFSFKTSLGWSPEFKASMSAASVTLVEFLALLGVADWIDILFGTKAMSQLPKWAVYATFFGLAVPNHYVLISRGYGLMFVSEFARFTKPKRRSLLTICTTIMVSIVAFCIYTASLHRKMFP